MKTNVKAREATSVTYEGAPAAIQSAEKELLRTVSCCMLYEDSFYEDSSSIANRIAELCQKVSMKFLHKLAISARRDMKLRHVSLYLCVQMLKKPGTPAERELIGDAIFMCIMRADELAEIYAIYRKCGGKGEPRQLKCGVASAFCKFSEYSLQKYNRDGQWKLRDALMVSHPKPLNDEQSALWKRLLEGKLATPRTWEVMLSAGGDKNAVFTELMESGELGYLALLRNLRNMIQAGVDIDLITKNLLDGAKGSKALPFRFVAAASHAPQLAGVLSDCLVKAVEDHPKLPGATFLVIDVSGSMNDNLSSKSDLTRMQAAAALGVLFREVCSNCRIFTFSNSLVEVSSYRGLPLIDGIVRSQSHCGTYLETALNALPKTHQPDRIVVVTDEQTNDGIGQAPAKLAYLINVATYRPALPTVGAGWKRISGFSEKVVDWMMLEESGD